MVRLGRLGIDGTKVRANASPRKAMSYGRMRERHLRAEIDELLKQARREDREGDELPQELRRREDRLAAINAAEQRLEVAQREADEKRGGNRGSSGT